MKRTAMPLIRILSLSILLFGACSSSDPSPKNEPTKVYIYSVVASPTASEAITIKNNSGTNQDLSNWTLGDKNDPNAYNIPNGTMLNNGQTKTFAQTTLGFGINDSGETIYLKNSSGTLIDSWSN